MTAKARILLVEDEPEIAEFVATELRFEGFEVRVEHDGMRGMIAARQDPPDLLILDRMLPGLDGLEITRRLRKTSDVPIILLTARGEPRERVEGLNAGANDYFEVGGLGLDTESREVRREGQPIALTPKEFDLLKYLIANARQVRTREQILEAVWGYDFGGEDNVLEVYVRYLRNKIEKPDLPKLLHTVRGVGYVLKDTE